MIPKYVMYNLNNFISRDLPGREEELVTPEGDVVRESAVL